VVSLLSSKIGGPEGIAPILSSGELPCEGQLHRRYSHGVGFQIFFNAFSMFCRMKGFMVAGVQIPPTNLLIKSNPTAGGYPQTQFGTRYGWPLAHKELLHPFTGFVLHPAGCPYHTPSSPRNLVGVTV